jgi:Tfp pilus assembly PilM family ATPase
MQSDELSADVLRDWRSHSGEIGSALKRMLGARRFIGRGVVSCLPDSLLEYRNIRLETTSGLDLSSVVRSRCGAELGLPADRYQIQFFDAGEVWEDDALRREIIVVAAPVNKVHEYLKLLTQCGLVPIALDATPAALARALPAPLMIDIGYEWTTVVMTQERRVRFVRRLSFGLRVCDDAASRTLHLPREEVVQMRDFLAGTAGQEVPWPFSGTQRETAEEAISRAHEEQGAKLAREISKCVQYHDVAFRTRHIDSCLVTGGGAREQALIHALAKGGGMRFRGVDAATDGEWVALASETMPPRSVGRWAVAAGLSLYGMTGLSDRVAACPRSTSSRTTTFAPKHGPALSCAPVCCLWAFPR